MNRLSLDNGGTRYFHPSITIKAALNVDSALHVAQSVESDTYFIVPDTGTINNLYVTLSAAPTAGKSWIFTVTKGGVDTTVTTTISDSATTGNSSGNSFSVVAGDLISIKQTSSGTPTNTTAIISLEVAGTVSGRSAISGGTVALNANTWLPTGVFYNLSTGTTTTNRNRAYRLVPHALTITGIYVNMTTAPGVGASRTFSLVEGPFGSANAIAGATVTISGTSTSGNVTGLSEAMVAEDLLFMQESVAGGPAASSAMYTIVVEAATNGNSWLQGIFGVTGRADGYAPLVGADFNLTNGLSTDDVYVGGTEFSLLNFYIQLDSGFSAADAKVMALQKNGSDTALTFTLQTSTQVGSNIVDTVSVATGDDLNIRVDHTGTGTGTGQIGNISFTQYVPPGGVKNLPLLGVG